jgi:hypothetical protein
MNLTVIKSCGKKDACIFGILIYSWQIKEETWKVIA